MTAKSGWRRGWDSGVRPRWQGVGGPRAGCGEPRGERYEFVGGHDSTLPARRRLRPLETPRVFWKRP